MQQGKCIDSAGERLQRTPMKRTITSTLQGLLKKNVQLAKNASHLRGHKHVLASACRLMLLCLRYSQHGDDGTRQPAPA